MKKHCLFFLFLSSWMVVALAGPPPTALAVSGTWQSRDMAFARVSVRQQAVLSLPFSA
ncbi:MAG: hypothetical protein ACE5ET_03995 [Gammaproteobacteria bacterium]